MEVVYSRLNVTDHVDPQMTDMPHRPPLPVDAAANQSGEFLARMLGILVLLALGLIRFVFLFSLTFMRTIGQTVSDQELRERVFGGYDKALEFVQGCLERLRPALAVGKSLK